MKSQIKIIIRNCSLTTLAHHKKRQNLRPNDKSGLQRFSDDLKICNHTLEALGMMSEMSNQQYMMKIIERLPYYLKSRWLRVVKDIRHHDRAPNITDVVDFVSDAAEEVNDPVFGALVEAKKEYPPSRREPVKQRTTTSSFTTSTGNTNTTTTTTRHTSAIVTCARQNTVSLDAMHLRRWLLQKDFSLRRRLASVSIA